MREILRIAEVEGFPPLRRGYGYMNPRRLQADLVDALIRPAMRRASTLGARFPGSAALRRIEPVNLTGMLLIGEIPDGKGVG